ncbi:glycosyltransferase [Ensifer sp. CCNWLW204]|uniref:glycosyltransferase n=1 Tax=Ensifer sp. CCNWLW204 TaxID=3125799 RepID=UPI00301511A4
MPALINSISKTYLKLVELLPRQKTVRSNYEQLRAAFDSRPNANTANALQLLIGTISPIEDVFAAMEVEFDADYYLSLYSDVRDSGLDPYFHYIAWGWKENRKPSKFFEPEYYAKINRNLDPRIFPIAHYLRNGRATGIAANPISSKIWFEPFVPDEAAWLGVPAALRQLTTRAVVVIPVYKGYEETLTSVYQALYSREDAEYSVLVVNDNSPDEKLVEKLAELARRQLFEYHDSHVNRGFVQTINFALEHLTADKDVVLLNSDAYVFPGWFQRLIQHADRDENVATVTPLSNNATICSYPTYDHDNCLALEVDPGLLDQLASAANRGLSAETPTGVGFCFYIRRAAIDKIGALDSDAFALGYGEENDFCMRAIHAGFKNVIAGDVFVYHTGSVSFSSAKQENYTRGQHHLERKHPNYSSLVRRHLQADPERILRRNLDAERLAVHFRGAVLVVTHNWSGGIETYIRHYSGKLAHEGKQCIILRVHDRWRATLEVPSDIGVYVPNLGGLDLRKETKFLSDLIERLDPSLVHVNSFAGLDWSSHRRLLKLISGLRYPVTFVGHDFSPVSHNYQLMRPDHLITRAPELADVVSWDIMHNGLENEDVCELAERIASYAEFFESGVCVEVPSQCAFEIYKGVFPKARISIVPHDDHLPETQRAIRRGGDKLRVVVVGAIGPHKGSDVVAALAADAQNRALPIEYHLLGYSDDDSRLKSSGVVIWGRYGAEGEALEMLDEIGPDLFFVPSVWPETYCYTLSIAIKKLIPTVVFDLGAQAERVRGLTWGTCIPLELAANPTRLSDQLLSLAVDEMWENVAQVSGRTAYKL